jgi:hypothetical protein
MHMTRRLYVLVLCSALVWISKLHVKPLALRRKAIISGDWYKFEEFTPETRLPSAFQAWLYMRMVYRLRGVRTLPAPLYGYSSSYE